MDFDEKNLGIKLLNSSSRLNCTMILLMLLKKLDCIDHLLVYQPDSQLIF